MRWLIRSLVWGVSVLCLGTLLLLWLALARAPTLIRDEVQMSAADVSRARRWMADADPRRAKAGDSRVLFASARDLDLLANDASRRLLKGAARVDVGEEAVEVHFSAPVPRVPGRWWMNWRVVLTQETQGPPGVRSLHVGALRVPTALAEWGLHRALSHLELDRQWLQALEMVQHVRMSPAGVQVAYRWQPGFEDRVRAGLVPPEMQEALRAYSDRLVDLVRPSGALAEHRPVSLAVLLPPLFELARQRTASFALMPASAEDGALIRAHAARENRAALITLALYAAQRPMSKLVPGARDWRLPHRREVWLGQRTDHPQHLLISAVLAAEGGGRLADVIGVYKEISDSKDGSGFSFDDLAADRAGTRLGQRATADPLGLQMRLSSMTNESDVMPSIQGLPSFLPESEFRVRFGRIGSPAYNRVAQEIEQRIQNLAFNQ